MSELHAGIIQTMDILAEKIGMDKVEFLETECHPGRRYQRDRYEDASGRYSGMYR